MPLSEAQEFVGYWANGYDWRRLEAEINSSGNRRTLLDGLGIHFIHAESRHENALPVILTHGWPGSIVEFLDSMDPWWTQPGTAERPRMRSMLWSFPRSRDSDFRTGRASRAGTTCALPARGLS